MVFGACPLPQSLHLAHTQRQKPIRVLEVLVLEDVDDCLLWAPDVKVERLVLSAPLKDDLLSLVELGKEHSLSITSWVTFDLLSNRLCNLQVLIDLALHEHPCLVRLLLEKLHDLHGVFKRNNIALFGSPKASLILHTQLPVAFGHSLIEVKCFTEVAPQKREADFVLGSSI